MPYALEVRALRADAVPEWSLESEALDKRPWMISVALDPYGYMVEDAFSHPWTPYRSKSTGELTKGCDKCGWAEKLHGPTFTALYCDRCAKLTGIHSAIKVGTVDRYSATDYWFHASHFFCTLKCAGQYFESHRPPEEAYPRR